ncbi:MAG: AAA family ATPase [Rickettsiales bacterium]|jgi:DNA polymerase-3 subunit delta'|nr:AAA family ATPase [Rickettsiales bacterium]
MENNLFQEFSNNKLHHSLLLVGKRGVGKFEIAKRLAIKILGEGSEGLVNSRTHPDFLLIEKEEKEKEIKIEVVDKIKDFIQLSASMSKNKVIIVNAVDEMTEKVQNAILKMVEEPHRNTNILLVCHNINNVLITIKSRCRKVSIPSLDYMSWKKAMIGGTQELYDMSGGSIYYANLILDNDGEKIARDIKDLLSQKVLNIEKLHVFADDIIKENNDEKPKKKAKENLKFMVFNELILNILYNVLKYYTTDKIDDDLKDFANRNNEKMILEKFNFVKNILTDVDRIYLNKKHSIVVCFLELSK